MSTGMFDFSPPGPTTVSAGRWLLHKRFLKLKERLRLSLCTWNIVGHETSHLVWTCRTGLCFQGCRRGSTSELVQETWRLRKPWSATQSPSSALRTVRPKEAVWFQRASKWLLPTSSFHPHHTQIYHTTLCLSKDTPQAISKAEILNPNRSNTPCICMGTGKDRRPLSNFLALYFSIPVNEAFFSSGISLWTKPCLNGACHLLLPGLVSLFFYFLF